MYICITINQTRQAVRVSDNEGVLSLMRPFRLLPRLRSGKCVRVIDEKLLADDLDLATAMDIVQAEALFEHCQGVLLFIISVVLGISMGILTGDTKVPVAVQFLLLVIGCRAKLKEAEARSWSAMQLWESISQDKLSFALNFPASFDSASHGIAIANMLLRTTTRVHARAVATFAVTPGAVFMVPIVKTLGIAGCAASSFMFSSYWQVCFIYAFGRNNSDMMFTYIHGVQRMMRTVMARLIGFGVVVPAGPYWKETTPQLFILQTFFESIPFLFWQVAFKISEGTGFSEDMVGTIASAITLAICMKGAAVAAMEYKSIPLPSDTRFPAFQKFYELGFPIILSWLALVYIVARYVVASFHLCASSDWGPATGCVPLCENNQSLNCVPPL